MTRVNSLPIFISIDSELDRAFVKGYKNPGKGRPSMKGFENAGDLIDLCSYFGKNVRFNWFIQCDQAVKDHSGSFNALFNEQKPLINELRKKGHGIGWHYHFFLWQKNNFIYETNEKKQASMLKEWHKALPKKLSILGSRAGNLYLSTQLMNALSDSGISFDFSCNPGYKPGSKGLAEAIKLRFVHGIKNNLKIDWHASPEKPFHPSRTNYMIPGKPKNRLLEVPLTVFSNGPWVACQPLKLAELEQKLPFMSHLHGAFHLDDVLDSKNFKMPFNAYLKKKNYSLASIKQNIEALISLSEKNYRRPEFISLHGKEPGAFKKEWC